MSESPECIKNIKSRLRSFFRLTPSQKNKNCRDEEGSNIDPTLSPDCKVDIDWHPTADGKYRKQFGKKMSKLKGSLFSPKPKDAAKGKRISTLNHPFVPYNCPSTTQKTRDPLPGFGEQRQIYDNNQSRDTSATARKMARDRFAAANIDNENHEKTPRTIRPTHKTQNSSDCPKELDNLNPKDNRERTPGFVVPLTSVPQGNANAVSTKRNTNTNISSKKESVPGEVHQSALPSKNKKTPEKNEPRHSLPQCTTPDKTKSKPSGNTVSGAKEDVEEEQTQARESKYDPSIAIPLPWNVVPKLGKEEVFIFTGNDSTESAKTSTEKKHQPQEPKPVVRVSPPQPTTVDRSIQCGLDIYPCTCDKKSEGQRVLCQNCVDVIHPIDEKVVTARNKSIHSTSSQTTKSETKKPVKYSSSKTQTLHSSVEDSSTKNAEKTVDNPGSKGAIANRLRDLENELQAFMECRQEARNTSDSQPPTNNTGACCNPPGTPARSKEQTERMDSFITAINRNPNKDRTNCSLRIGERMAKNVTPAQMTKIKELCNRLGRTRNGRASNFADLANDLTDITGNIGDLFMSVTTEELDRLDGINRTARSPGNSGEQELENESRVLPFDEDSPDDGSPVLGAVGGASISPQRKRRSSGRSPRRSPRSPRVPHSTPDSSSRPKRSRSLEDLGLLAIEPSNDPRPFKFRPFEPENIGLEYENPFEISGFIRTDDHIDCGQKAGRGHIQPEIKVKQKRRGEPNKHLTTQHKDNELNPEDELDESILDNCSGDWSMLIEPSDISTPGRNDTPLGDGDLGAAAAISDLPKEDEGVDEVLPDMRHCEAIPLEVIYGKKNDNEEEMDTPAKGKKKRKQKDKDRTNRGRPQLLSGLRLDL